MGDGLKLFCPEDGVFPVVVPDSQSFFSVAVAVPLDDETVLLNMAKTAIDSEVESILKQGLMQTFSISPIAPRVLIPPAILDAVAPELVQSTLEAKRATLKKTYG